MINLKKKTRRIKEKKRRKLTSSVTQLQSISLTFLKKQVWDHPYITSAKGLGGWGQEMAIFADVQYYLC